MAQFSCISCGYEGHYTEFRLDDTSEAAEDQADEPDLECPQCESTSIVEE